MLAQFPSQGNHGPFDEIQIPAGYQPSIDITEPCNEVVGTSIFGSGRYHISKGGGISLIVDNPAYCEHTEHLHGSRMTKGRYGDQSKTVMVLFLYLKNRREDMAENEVKIETCRAWKRNRLSKAPE